MRTVAPPRQARLDEPTRRRLGVLTAELLQARPGSADELRRYLSIRRRSIALPTEQIAVELRGCTVAVTGGSGCVGTALLRQLRRLSAGRVTSLAVTQPALPVPGVEYVHCDVRSPSDVESFFAQRRPDIVFHLAAQRDPGLAERRVAYTVDANVLGTRRVADAAERAGARRFVYASTGKALRPYAPCVYASTKRVGEWLVADVAGRGRLPCSGVRFTHVVDNSIVLDRLRWWSAAGEPIRLHSADTLFYAQSAIESAQLLLAAMLTPADDTFRLHMIRNLGWPVSLLDVAVGVIASHGAIAARGDILPRGDIAPRGDTAPRGDIAPLYIAGHDPGYEDAPYAGLYDPMLAGDVSPLMNAMEAHQVKTAACPGVDVVPVAPCAAPDVMNRLPELARWCAVESDRQAHRVLDEVAWELLESGVRATSSIVLDRIARLTRVHRPTMNKEHRRIDDIVRRYAGNRRAAPLEVGIADVAGVRADEPTLAGEASL